MSNSKMDEIIDAAPQNQLIQNTLMKMDIKLDHYRNPVCSVSGGSDSDIMMDVIERVRGDRPVTYVFFDTGIEHEATKRHLCDLEAKYNIKIERRNAVVPVPLGCRRCGVPFISKKISQAIDRLQRHEFQWEDEPFEVLVERYPDCISSLKWWCNHWSLMNGLPSKYNIKNLAYLKEFMVAHPPTFSISDKCCKGAKKDTGHLIDAEFSAGMKILGLRRAEGGIRATSYTGCFNLPESGGIANYRPLWFWSDEDKAEYKAHYGVIYSDCYAIWGFKRTGCAGCPFNSQFEDDLKTIEQYEPRLAIAAHNIFGESYAYTQAYREYRDRCKAEDRERKKEVEGQETLWE